MQIPRSTKSRIKRGGDKPGGRYTRSREVAIEIARETGEPPIIYINPKMRQVFLKAYPAMLSPVKRGK